MTPNDIYFRRWRTDADFRAGTAIGTVVGGDAITFGTPAGRLTYPDPHSGATGTYEFATWTSMEVAPGFGAKEIISSWIASTPGGSWIQIELRGATSTGSFTKWYVVARWAADDAVLRRTSVPAQGDADGTVSVDTFVATPGRELHRWQLRVTLLRPIGSELTPTLRSLGAVASCLPEPGRITPSTPQAALGVTLEVPRFSQEIHVGEYPQYDNGGQAWCSPTCTSMVMSYWGALPPTDDYAWVDQSYQDRWVDHAARHCFDYNYVGCGNWPFNVAYAGRYGLEGFVTRLRSLNEAELFIEAGLPLVLSASFGKHEIPGLDYSTNGHLIALVGFTADGEPILNDPNSPTDEDVRKPVGRAEFESAWLNSSRGVAYVMHPAGAALPDPPSQPNW
ncbi:hypothetical protein F4553_005850 [Allocatelliglobosispora scoriae]|uniref:Peptidase C39-like domain-containing protein n=1 Tax=Allocatelliglobosispora scoriae TaxID=643052 RepID=A0A841BY00_9ACTN|nr:C39 family peptidase [Allocatelliglobosispora scoriae]MBB5872416.1 hypothetical protein [Allocatelliglobosispora scoriae]